MVSRRAYKRVSVNALDQEVLAQIAAREMVAVLGLDIAKNEIVACLRWKSSGFERPWNIVNPYGIKDLVKLCSTLIDRGLTLSVAMESTGTYGESVRRAFTLAKISVLRVSGKHVSDYKEVFDGVPSQHDGKDAAMIAELATLGKGKAWPFEALPENLEEINLQVRRMDVFQTEKVQWLGRLEAEVTRYWPELTRYVKLGGVSTLRLLSEYGSPALAAMDKELRSKLTAWGHSKLSEAKIDQIIESASSTAGIPMSSQNVSWVKEISQRALKSYRDVKQCDQILHELLGKDEFWSRYTSSVGASTLSVILATVGDPRAYSSAGAILKALGLNLKERSSGKRIGEKAITKRGPSLARRWLFFWALRSVQREELKEWYHRFHSSHFGKADRPANHRRMKGIICMMRKLVRSLWSAVHSEANFEYSKVICSVSKSKRRRSRKASKRDSSALDLSH